MKTSTSLSNVINGTVPNPMLNLADETYHSALAVSLLHTRIKKHLFLSRHCYEISAIEFNNISRVLN